MPHRTVAAVVLGTCIVVFPAVATSQEAHVRQVFHWEDDSGTVYYTTGVESVPQRFRARARPMPLSTRPAPPPREEAAPAGQGTIIPFIAGSPMFVSARINGAGPVTLVLDTGADRTVVSPSALARLGIKAPPGIRAELRGVTGASAVDLVRVESLAVGTATIGPLMIVSHEANIENADGLLGRDFLNRFNVTIDSTANVVILTPTDPPR